MVFVLADGDVDDARVADRGLVPDELLAEPDVRTYCQRFGLEREGARITGA